MRLIAEDKATKVLEACRDRNIMLATAESCTGGLIAAALTDITGSADVVKCGYVTYSNEAKTSMINVPSALIEEKGAVSKEVAIAMAEGALACSKAAISVAVTGIAGPGGGSLEKPVGLVHIACAYENSPTEHREFRFGDNSRAENRHATVVSALDLMLEVLEK